MSFHKDTATNTAKNTDFNQLKDWPEVFNFEDPIILLDIVGTVNSGAVAYHFSTKDYLTTSGVSYKAGILNDVALTKALADIIYGVQTTDPISVDLTNVDDGINDTWDEIIATMTGLEDIRGWVATAWARTEADGIRFLARGKITDYTLANQLSISIDPREDAIFDTVVPGLVTVADFDATALNVGSPINICFGYCRNVPCPNIQNDTGNDYYDYLIGYGTLQSLQTGTGLGVKRDGIVVASSEYTFYDGSQGSPFTGYAFIRFVKEQLNFSGGYHNITADVIGLEMGEATAQRNGAEVLRQLLSNTTWGISDSVNTASFDAAATVLHPTTGSLKNIYIDGAITSQSQVRDFLNELQEICRASFDRNRSGEWEITIDYAGRASVLTLNDQNFQIEEVSATPVDSCLKSGEIKYYWAAKEANTPAQTINLDIHTNFGFAKVKEYHFVKEDNTAKKILSYMYGREMYSEGSRNGIVSGFAGIEARLVRVNDIVTLTNSARSISAQNYVVMSTDYSPGTKPYAMTLRKYSADIYADQVITAPTGMTEQEPGDEWVGAMAEVGGIAVFKQDAIPTSLSIGDLWFDTNDSNKSYKAACIGADAITAGEWESVTITALGDATNRVDWDGTDLTADFNGVVNMAAQGGCAVNRTTNQSIEKTTWTTINWDVEDWDTGNEFNLATDRFTLAQDTKLFISCNALSKSGGWQYGDEWEVGIYVNGAQVKVAGQQAIVDTIVSCFFIANISAALNLEEDDYVELKVFHTYSGYGLMALRGRALYTFASFQKIA